MADFKAAYKITEKWEGNRVYAILKGDKGGETYAGLARIYNPDFKGWPVIDAEKKKYPGGRIPNGTKIPAAEPWIEEYYYRRYWLAQAKGDKIQNQQVANLVFDMVVNHGKGERVVNQAIRNAGGKIPLSDNITADTLKFLNADPAGIYPFIWKAREQYIKGLPDFSRFGTGWLNRLNDFPKAIAGAVSSAAASIGATVSDPGKKKS